MFSNIFNRNNNLMKSINEIIGEIIKSVQYIEWNLLNSLNRDTFEEMTLGQIINIIKNESTLSKNEIKELEDILKKRNDLIHQYFKRYDFEKHSTNIAFLIQQKNYLDKLYNQVKSFNDKLVSN